MRYADDTTLLATSPEKLQHQVNELQKISLLFGLEINSAKTCMMVINPANIVLIDGKETERVNKFKYLGSLVTVDSNSTSKAHNCKTCYSTAKGIWKAKDIGMDLKTLIWSTALYGSESWALNCDEKLLTAFEMCEWRWMLRISWTEQKTNKWIREKIGIPEEKGTLEQIKHRKLSKYCHWKRSDGVVLATIEGEIEGKCFPGRKRTAWIDEVRLQTGNDMNVARTNATERKNDCW